MGVKDLKNRKVINIAIDIEILERLDKYSKETGIPKTRICDRALTEFFERYKGKDK